MAKITFVFEDGQDVVVPIDERVTIGRAEDNDVVVEDERLSRYHAELLMNADGSVQVFDQQSRTGTFVNGQRIISHTLLHGDKLSFGPLQAILDLEHPANIPQSKPTLPAPPKKTARVPVTTPQTASAALDPGLSVTTRVPVTTTRERQADAAVRQAENRLALLQVAEKQARESSREWTQSLEKIQLDHAARQLEFQQLTHQIAQAEARLQDLQTNEKAHLAALQRETGETLQKQHQELEAKKTELAELTAQLEKNRTQLQSLEKDLATRQSLLDTARSELTALQSTAREAQRLTTEQRDLAHSAAEQLTALQQRHTALQAQVDTLQHTQQQLTHTQNALTEAEARQKALHTALQCLSQDRESHETALTRLETQAATAQEQLHVTRQQQAEETRRLEEIRSRIAELQAQHSAPLKDLENDIEAARQELATLRAELRPMRNWHHDMRRRHSRLATLPPGSADAQELKDEIQAELEHLHQLIITPSNETPQTIQAELLPVSPVPMKSATVRPRQS
ncbi:MAG: FHA domain-containing protein [Verrucomicrobiaceae bacterium]|nr:FHA domain-containing protein [Verrucomicrobiaceae bacterium]